VRTPIQPHLLQFVCLFLAPTTTRRAHRYTAAAPIMFIYRTSTHTCANDKPRADPLPTYIIVGVIIGVVALVFVLLMCCCDCRAICGHKSRKPQVNPETTPPESEDGFEIVHRAPSRNGTRCVLGLKCRVCLSVTITIFVCCHTLIESSVVH
jgi:hypothetical protein